MTRIRQRSHVAAPRQSVRRHRSSEPHASHPIRQRTRIQTSSRQTPSPHRHDDARRGGHRARRRVRTDECERRHPEQRLGAGRPGDVRLELHRQRPVDAGTTNTSQGVPGLTNPILACRRSHHERRSTVPPTARPFTLELTWQFTLPASLAAARGGTRDHDSDPAGRNAPDRRHERRDRHAYRRPLRGPSAVNLGDGTQDVPFQQVRSTATFTRSGTGTPVVLTPGTSPRPSATGPSRCT